MKIQKIIFFKLTQESSGGRRTYLTLNIRIFFKILLIERQIFGNSIFTMILSNNFFFHTYKQDVCNFIQDVCNFEQDVCNFEKDVCNFQQDVWNFEHDVCYLEQDVCKFGQDLWNFEQDLCNFEQDVCYFEQDFCYFEQDICNLNKIFVISNYTCSNLCRTNLVYNHLYLDV